MADAREVGQRFIDAFNAHDQERIRELNGENAVFEAPGDVRVEGREAATEYAMAWLRAFPDARITVHNAERGQPRSRTFGRHAVSPMIACRSEN